MLDDLVSRAKGGDYKAEEQIFSWLYERFTTFASRKIGGDQVEDIAQEACKVIAQKYKETEFTVGFEAWAYGVLKYTISNYIRKSKVRNKFMTPEMESQPASSTETDHELRMTLIDCLKKIFKRNPRYARALNFINQGYKTDEIGKKLKVSQSNLYVILHRSRSMLKECLETGSI